MPDNRDIHEVNREFYDSVWRRARVQPPETSSTWDLLQTLAPAESRPDEPLRQLEVGPGLRPRLPLDRALFVDLSQVAVDRLRRAGACAVRGSVAALPFADECFELIFGLDVIEHAEDPAATIRELGRVLQPAGHLCVSVPLHASRWTAFDRVVGHHKRFDPHELEDLILRAGFQVERSAAFGLQPRFRSLMWVGSLGLRTFPSAAAWFEDRLWLPIHRRLQKPIDWTSGFAVPPRADGVIVVAKRCETASNIGKQTAKATPSTHER